jgi:Flp pilus assembly protein TadG
MLRWNSLSTLSHRLRRHARQDRGQALVEFAIVLPVLILIIMGILYFGRYENYANQETELAGQAARWAAVDVNPSSTLTLQNYVKSQASGELANGSGDVTSAMKVFIYYPTGSSNAVGNSVRACLTATVRFPFLAGMTQAITQTATMRIEQVGTTAVWTADSTSTASAAGCSIS